MYIEDQLHPSIQDYEDTKARPPPGLGEDSNNLILGQVSESWERADRWVTSSRENSAEDSITHQAESDRENSWLVGSTVTGNVLQLCQAEKG